MIEVHERVSECRPQIGLGNLVFPVSGFAATVGHSDDFKPVGSFSIYLLERKAARGSCLRLGNIFRMDVHMP